MGFNSYSALYIILVHYRMHTDTRGLKVLKSNRTRTRTRTRTPFVTNGPHPHPQPHPTREIKTAPTPAILNIKPATALAPKNNFKTALKTASKPAALTALKGFLFNVTPRFFNLIPGVT